MWARTNLGIGEKRWVSDPVSTKSNQKIVREHMSFHNGKALFTFLMKFLKIPCVVKYIEN